jgi:hypothetical protein
VPMHACLPAPSVRPSVVPHAAADAGKWELGKRLDCHPDGLAVTSRRTAPVCRARAARLSTLAARFGSFWLRAPCHCGKRPTAALGPRTTELRWVSIHRRGRRRRGRAHGSPVVASPVLVGIPSPIPGSYTAPARTNERATRAARVTVAKAQHISDTRICALTPPMYYTYHSICSRASLSSILPAGLPPKTLSYPHS